MAEVPYGMHAPEEGIPVEKMVMFRNLRTEDKHALFAANKAWSACISDNFLPNWLNKSSDATIEEVCCDELTSMRELNESVYGESPMPFAPL